MSNKRAAIRREQKLRNKINNKAQTGNIEAVITKAFTQGYDKGVTVGTAIIFMALNELYGFSHMESGKGRLDKLIEKISEEFVNMAQEPTRFTCDYYVRMLQEQTGIIVESEGDAYEG